MHKLEGGICIRTVRICAVVLGDGRLAYTQVGVLSTPSDTRVADVGVFASEPDPRAAWHPAGDLTLVVGVWSPSSGDKDRNPRWYADRGIAEYWLAEPIEGDTWGAPITQYQLARTPAGTAAYVETGRTTLAALEADPTA
jgi:Uma2 family endonuclease